VRGGEKNGIVVCFDFVLVASTGRNRASELRLESS
jgi:hypothetical protein